MQPQQGVGDSLETRDTSGSNHSDMMEITEAVESAADVPQPSSQEISNGTEEKSPNDGIQSIKERIINTSRLLRILEKQRTENQTTTDNVKELKAQIDQLVKEKGILSKQTDNQNMELEKLKKDFQKQGSNLDEVKAERDRMSKELDQAMQDKSKAESAKRSYEMLCEQLKAQNAELSTGVPVDEKLRKELLKLRSLSDQHKSQAQSNNIALKAEQQAHQSTLTKNASLQRSVNHLEETVNKLQNENAELTQTNETLNEQIFEMNLNQQMEINELKDELDRSKRGMEEQRDEADIIDTSELTPCHTNELDTPVKRGRVSKKDVDQIKLELTQAKIELKTQVDRGNELQERLNSASAESNQVQQLKNEILELKESNEKLRKDAEHSKELLHTSTSKSLHLEQSIAALQMELSKAQDQRSRAQSSPLPPAHGNKKGDADKYAALKADYQLVIAENKYLKKAKDVLQDKTTDFLIRIDELEKQLRSSIQQVIANGVDALLDKDVPSTTPERREFLASAATSPVTPSRPTRSAEVQKEPTRAKKTSTTLAPVEISSTLARKRKSISVETEVPEPAKPVAKKSRKKVSESERETIVPVTDYTKLINDILQSVLSSSLEDTVASLETARIYTTLKTDLLLYALEAVCTALDTAELVQEDGIVFEEEFGVSEWLVMSLADNLDIREKRLIWFLYALCSLSSNTRFYDRLCSWMSTTMISQVGKNTAKACRISRIFINVCKAAEDLGRVRVFCYDILREISPNCQSILIFGNFAHSWSLPLKSDSKKDETSLPADNLILKSIQLGVNKLAADHTNDLRIRTAIGYLEHYCYWQPSDDMPELVDFLDDITNAIIHPGFQKLKETDLVEFQEHRFNVMKATELVYFHHGDWEFTYQVFISSVVYPLLQDPQYIDFSLELIGALGRKALFEESDEKLGLAGLRSEMSKALTVNAPSADEFQHQVSAAIALMNLSNGKAILARPLVQWYRDLTPENKASLPSPLSEAIKVITKDGY